MSHANKTNKIWHEIFGHLNFKYLKQLHNDNMVEGFPSIQTFDGICAGWLVDNNPETKYDVGKARRVVSTLDLIQSDVAGPIPTNSINGCRYFLMIVLGIAGSTS